MKKEYCDIFNECFPQFHMKYGTFSELLGGKDTVWFELAEGGETAAFAAVEDFAVRLICVKPSLQRRGIGKKLLQEAESYLRSRSYDKVITGGVSSRLFIGAVSDSRGFFEKCGYSFVGGCDEMLMDLKDFSLEALELRGRDTAEYGWYEGDEAEIKAAVAQVEEDWCRYFTKESHIFVGRVGGEIASFCQVDTDCRNYLTDAYGRVGMPGCVGTVPKFRNKGIALEMVALATEYLKEQGMDISFIFFTGVAKWYEKIGYRTFLSEVFGEKNIR